MNEIWEPVKGYEGLYEVSNLGRVKSLNYKRTKQEKILKPNITKANYQQVHLCKDKKIKILYIHRLVAETFIPNHNNYPCVNHKDENSINNVVNNLEWCDKKYNNNYGNCKEKHSKEVSIPINQYDLKDNFIKQWNSMKEAQETLKISRGNICLCCQGKRNKTGGYKWRYANND